MAYEKVSYLQIERPVLEGGRDFLNKARDIGERVLGEELRTSITELAMVSGETNYDTPRLVNVVMPVSEPNFQIVSADSLKVVLLHRRAEKQVASRYAFGTIFNRLNRVVKPVYPWGGAETPPWRKQTLYEQLDQVSQNAGADTDSLPVWFDSIDIVARQAGRIVFGLVPRQNEALSILEEQEAVCEAWLRQQSPKLAELEGVTDGLAVRFASAPENVPSTRIDLLLGKLAELPPVRMSLGEPDARLKDSRRN